MLYSPKHFPNNNFVENENLNFQNENEKKSPTPSPLPSQEEVQLSPEQEPQSKESNSQPDKRRKLDEKTFTTPLRKNDYNVLGGWGSPIIADQAVQQNKVFLEIESGCEGDSEKDDGSSSSAVIDTKIFDWDKILFMKDENGGLKYGDKNSLTIKNVEQFIPPQNAHIWNHRQIRSLTFSNLQVDLIEPLLRNIRQFRNLQKLAFHKIDFDTLSLQGFQHLEVLEVSDCKNLRGMYLYLTSWKELRCQKVPSNLQIHGFFIEKISFADLIVDSGNRQNAKLPALEQPVSAQDDDDPRFSCPCQPRTINLTRFSGLVPLSNFQPRVSWFNGNLRELHLIQSTITDVNILENAPNLQTLELTLCPRIQNLDVIKKLPNLKSLQLNRLDNLTSIDFLNGNSSLQTIFFRNMRHFHKKESLIPLATTNADFIWLNDWQ